MDCLRREAFDISDVLPCPVLQKVPSLAVVLCNGPIYSFFLEKGLSPGCLLVQYTFFLMEMEKAKKRLLGKKGKYFLVVLSGFCLTISSGGYDDCRLHERYLRRRIGMGMS
jgi:hypothetical protein